MRAVEGREPHQQARLLAAREHRHPGVGLDVGEAELGALAAHLRLAGQRHQRAHALERRGVFIEVVDLVLREKADLQLRRAADLAVHRLEPAGDELGEGRLAVAVGAEQADSVVVGDDEAEVLQDRLAVVADRDVIHRDDRRLQRLSGEGRMIGNTSPSTIAEIGSILASALSRLCACVALVAEARKRRRRPAYACAARPALLVLLLDRLLLAALLLEARVIAGPQRQLTVVEVQDMVADRIQHVADRG